MIDAAVYVCSWVFILATAIAFLKHEAWWIRVFDFPRSQIALGGAICLVAFVVLSDLTGAFALLTFALLAGATAYQVIELSAYTPLRRKQALPAEFEESGRRVRLLIGNVLMTNRSASEYLRLIERESPDIVVLAEPDGWWEEQMKPIEEEYKYSMRCALPNTYGMLLYSRLPLSDERLRFIVEEDIPSFHCTVTLRNGDSFDLHSIHPRPPHIGVDTTERDAEIIILARELENTARPVIVTGDLNDVAWSHTTRLFLRISGLLDPRIGRKFCNTFNAKYFFARWPLDHLFHSRAFRYVELRRLPRCGSDHFPVLVELSFEPEVRKEQERPVADVEDQQEAERKIENVAHKRGEQGPPLPSPAPELPPSD